MVVADVDIAGAERTVAELAGPGSSLELDVTDDGGCRGGRRGRGRSRPTRRGIQQCGVNDVPLCLSRTRYGRMGSDDQRQPVERLCVHETRTATDDCGGKRRHRQHILGAGVVAAPGFPTTPQRSMA